ncbi:MAG TPA: PKD domain-containing protein, partial [Bacteroidia bacterium]|nr:PKD domain-containing protein [Bacteroidia bacterium]
GATYSWTGPNGFISTTQNPSVVNVPAADSGTYTLTINNGCASNSVPVVVIVHPQPVSRAGAGTSVCEGTLALLSGSITYAGGGTWSSSGNGSFSPSATTLNASYLPGSNDVTSGTVWLFLTSTGNGTCSMAKDSLKLRVNPKPVADFKFTVDCKLTQADFQDASTLSHGTIQSWKWQFGDSLNSNVQNITHTYAGAGTYLVSLTVKSDSGCMASRLDTVVIPHCSEAGVNPAALPSAFTPNGDGHNDIFYVRGGPFLKLDFAVYNNWGNLIFHSTSQNDGWDGTYNGALQPGGTYVWIVTGETIDNRPVKLSGNVTLIR